jgi:2-polyprenyl-3-methyl-5-hydroxy-6-metoxy-1,4-benzoquinol methylase
MVMKLDSVIPFGRSLTEYQGMFQLSPDDMEREILDIAGGPASFNAEMAQLGHAVTSIDPIYEFSSQEIQKRFDACVDSIEMLRISLPA